MKTTSYFQTPTETQPAIETIDEGGLHLGQTLSALRRRAWLIILLTAAVASIAGMKALFDTPTYRARFEILVQRASAESQVTSSLQQAVPEQIFQRQTSLDDLLQILSSSKVLLPVVEQIKAESPEICEGLSNEGCYNLIRDRLEVKLAGKNSAILQVSYEGLEPREVQTILDLTSRAYLDYSLQSRQNDIQLGLKFVESKLPDLQQRVETLQRDLQDLRQRYNLIDPDSLGQQLNSQVTTFKQQQAQSEIDLAQKRAALADLQSQVGSESAAATALSANPRYQTLLTQLLDLDRRIAEASSIYLDTTPDMQALRDERQGVLALIARESVQVQRESASQLTELEVRDQAIQSALGELNGEVNEWAIISRIYTDIQRELQISTETLNQFIAKQQTLQIDAAQREAPWDLLTPTTNPQPYASNVPRNLLLGGALGLVLGTGAALLMGKLTDVVYTPEELKRITKLPILGSIPLRDNLAPPLRLVSPPPRDLQLVEAGNRRSLRNGNGNYRSFYDADPFSEAFRSLYANIRLISNTDRTIRSCVVSSTQSGEGKSITSIYLAQAAAAMGQRVLLVDTDLRYPRLHEYLGLANRGGLIDLIAGDIDLSNAIQRSPMEKNFYILTAGAIPPDPTRVISSQRMQQFMHKMENNFDLVIYDTPPLVGFADPYLLAAHTNGLILVTQLGRIKRSQIDQSLEQIRVSSIPVLGIVLQQRS